MTEDAEWPGQIIRRWWGENLRPDDFESGAVRGFRARLRRADQPLDVLADAQVVALYEALGKPPDPLTLAALVSVLAHVKKHDRQRIARAFGPADDPHLSTLRFQRLIRSPDRAALAVALRRALPLIDHACDVAALGADFLYWGEAVRIRWCFDYFGKAAPAEPTGTSTGEPE